MIEISGGDGVRVLRLCHGKASALDLELCDALDAALIEARESDARALVITGTGTIFSAGVDLHRVVAGGRAYIERFLPAFDRAMRTLYFLEKPVVAAINGHAVAGGMVIACACDHRVLTRGKATVGVPELRVGVPFPAIAVEILRRAIAAQHVSSTLFLGRTVPPDEALARGFADEVCDPDSLLPRSIAIARELGALEPRSFALTKRLARAPAFDALDRHEARASAEMLDVWSAPQTLRAIAAYVERTIKK